MNLYDEIAAAAYELFETRGYVFGRDLDDWLEAERIVLSRHAGQELEEPEETDTPEEMAAAAKAPGVWNDAEGMEAPYYGGRS